MTAVQLRVEPVAKPWGRRALLPWHADVAAGARSIGELIYRLPAGAAAPPLLLKALFTRERLSVQVHPGDAAAKTLGHACGKDEAWIVLAAEPGAATGLGLKAEVSEAALRAAAMDGSIVDMLDWRPVAAGDVIYVEAGTIHAVGGGITLIEVQQNLDLTFRLYDYGSDRPLQLDAALRVARREPQPTVQPAGCIGDRQILSSGGKFTIERIRLDGAARLAPAGGRPVWAAVIAGAGRFDAAAFGKGQVWYCDAATTVAGSAELLLAYPGGDPVASLWTGTTALEAAA